MAALLQFLILSSISITILADCDYCYTKEPQYAEDAWSDEYGETQFLIGMCRHGARNPLVFPPKDQNNTQKYFDHGCWKEGAGQLTNEGKCQAWDSGKWMGYRMRGWDITPYQSYFAEIDCSRSDRADITGQLFGRACFNDTVEIRVLCPTTDNMLEFTATCNEYEKEKSSLRNNTELLDFYNKYEETFHNITEYTGWNCTPELLPSCMDYGYYCLDTLTAEEKCSGVTPEWGKYLDKKNLTIIAIQALKNRVFTKSMQKLRVGPLLYKILLLFKSVVEDKRGDPWWFQGFMCHDMTMVGLMHTLGINVTQIPPTASCLLIELRKKVDENKNQTIFTVTIGHRNSTTSPPTLLYAKELEDFKNATADVVSVNWDQDCGNDNNSSCSCKN